MSIKQSFLVRESLSWKINFSLVPQKISVDVVSVSLWCIYIELNPKNCLFWLAIFVININYARTDILQLIAYYLRRFHVLFYLLSLVCLIYPQEKRISCSFFDQHSVITILMLLYFLFFLCLFLYIRFCTYNAIWCAQKHSSCFSNNILFFSLSFPFPDCCTIGHSLVDLLVCSLTRIHPVPIENMLMQNILQLLFIGNKQRCAAHLFLSFLFRTVWRDRTKKIGIDSYQRRRSISTTKQHIYHNGEWVQFFFLFKG